MEYKGLITFSGMAFLFLVIWKIEIVDRLASK